jgi:dTDP-4-dehydrorhamnose reductase
MKVLICGARGQLGSDCANVLAAAHRIVVTDLDELDITDAAAVERFVGRQRPEVVVNCAAYTRVDDCESQVDLADRINHRGPAHLAAAADATGASLIHVSTDYVFDGTKPLPSAYNENDLPHPLSAYGRTKLAGETAVAGATDNVVILRTAWLYGIGGPNFLKTMLRLALGDPEREIRVVNDQHGSPTWSYRLATQIAALIGTPLRGVCHATATGSGTWYDLASLFLKEMQVPHRLAPCTTAQYPTPARRPQNSILENRRLKAAGLHCMSDWREDLVQFVARYRKQLLAEATEAIS